MLVKRCEYWLDVIEKGDETITVTSNENRTAATFLVAAVFFCVTPAASYIYIDEEETQAIIQRHITKKCSPPDIEVVSCIFLCSP